MREFRKAESHDDFDIASISIAGWKFAYKGIMEDEQLKSLDPKKRAKARSNFIKPNTLSTFVCLESGKLVGFVDFAKSRDSDSDGKTGEVWAIYVLPEFIGKNIGKKLFSMSLHELAKNGCKEATVWVLRDNKIARDFYKRQGFILDGAEKEYQGLGLVEVRYRKNIEIAT